MAPWQDDFSANPAGLWRSIFYSEFTIVRTAILMPILVLYLLVLMRLVSVRGDSESTLLNRIGLTAFGVFIATAPLRASTPLTTALVGITTLSLMNLLLNGLNYAGILPSILLAPKPTLLVAHGQLLRSQMRKVFMTPEKVQAQLRKAGYASLEAVMAAVMEPDGRCIPYGGPESGSLSLLQSVDGFDKFLAKGAHAARHQQQHSHTGAPAGDLA